jgi:hypothetical protein
MLLGKLGGCIKGKDSRAVLKENTRTYAKFW